MYSRILNKALLFGLILPGAVFACGRSFPNSYLGSNGDKYLLQPPQFSFYDEISRINLNVDDSSVVFNPERSKTRSWSVAQIEAVEIRKSLEASLYDSDLIKKTLTSYGALRKKIETYRRQLRMHSSKRGKGSGKTPKPEIVFIPDQIPDILPREFALYLEGVYYYRIGDHVKAVQIWQKLLDLPAQDRHYKTTWAAFMIAKCYDKQGEKDKACSVFRSVRQYAREGFADSLDLAATSYGDQAAIYLWKEQYEKAVELYLIQTLTGDPTAMPSLMQVCRIIFDKHAQLDLSQLINDRMLRQVSMAFAITRSARYDSYTSKEDGVNISRTSKQLLLDAIEKANIDVVDDADRMAAIAYRGGGFKRAKRWLDMADPDSLMGRHIRAKLFLQDGKIKEAAEDLAFIARQTGPGQLMFYGGYNRTGSSHRIHSELGTLYVSRKMFVKAVDALIKGGNWMDAAYIAERVLTPDELQGYVDANWPESMLETTNEDTFDSESQKALKIRHLLARRLSRMGEFEKAEPYYPNKFLNDFQTFAYVLSRGDDQTLPDSERADALWNAAWLMRHKGMEFIGAELEPDGYIWRGNFPVKDSLEKRLAALKKRRINLPTQDEIDRAKLHAVLPDRRFHYRYFASELAWDGAELMPDEDNELARRLCLAGIWHRDRDNEYADIFYKSLVIRCGTTELGKEADKIRWFPKIADKLQDGELILPKREVEPVYK